MCFPLNPGKTSDVTFFLTDSTNGQNIPISIIRNKPQKFLGSHVTALNKPQDMFQFLNDKFENIDESYLRGE